MNSGYLRHLLKTQRAVLSDDSLSRCGIYPEIRRDAAALGWLLLWSMVGITSYSVG